MNDDSEKSLKDRIAAAKSRQDAFTKKNTQDDETDNDGTAMGQAMRVGIELVVAVGVGTFMGYWLDQWLGTAPFGMIILFFAGFAAGFLNIWREQTGNYHKTGLANQTEPVNTAGDGLTNSPKDGQKNTNKNQD